LILGLSATALLAAATSASVALPKDVFVFLGDGMANAQIQATEAYSTTVNPVSPWIAPRRPPNYASLPNRGLMNKIATQLANTGYEFFGGAGLVAPEGPAPSGDTANSVWDLLSTDGYTVFNDRVSILSLKTQPMDEVIAINPTLDRSSAMPYAIDRPEGNLSLADGWIRSGWSPATKRPEPRRDRARPGGANRYNPTARPPVFRFALSGEE
jgi:hypothetical protein